MESQEPLKMEERGRRVREGNMTMKMKVTMMGLMVGGAQDRKSEEHLENGKANL